MPSSKITQAFVLGAGLGTRLRPLTDDLPKPLVPIFQKPLITFALDHLVELGLERFFINTHHLAGRFREAFPDATYRHRPIAFFHESDLLETAGGIANIAGSLGQEPLLVYNGDILTDMPLGELIENHLRAKNIVTLALRANAEPRHIAFDPSSGRVVDIRNQLGTGAPDEFLFTGIYIVEPEFVDLLTPGVKRSVIPHFVDLIRAGAKIGGVVIDRGDWWDVGNRSAYLQLHRDLSSLPFPDYPVDPQNWRRAIHESAQVDTTARITGCSVVGKDCRVDAGAVLADTIVWAGSQIASRSNLSRCIVRTRKAVSGTHHDIDL